MQDATNRRAPLHPLARRRDVVLNVGDQVGEESSVAIVPKGQTVERVPVSFRMPADLRDELERVGRETGNTMTDALMWLLRYAIREYDREKADASSDKLRARKST